jgi:hypothetical protein
MLAGMTAVVFLSNVLGVQTKIGITEPFVLSFPWRITLGTFVTIGIAMLFRTPDSRQASARAIDEVHAKAAGA